MGRHFILFVLTSALLFCLSNAMRCKYYDHACLGGNGKRSAIGQSEQDFVGQPLKRDSFIADDDNVYPQEKRFVLSPTLKRLAKLILRDESQK